MLSSDHDSDAGVSTPQKLLCRSPLTQHISSFDPTSCFSHSQKSKCPMSHLNSATRKQVPPPILLSVPVSGLTDFCVQQCLSTINVHSSHLWITLKCRILVQQFWPKMTFLLLVSVLPLRNKVLEFCRCLNPCSALHQL